MSEYVAFSDESRNTASRYRSIAAVSLPVSEAAEARHALTRLISDSKCSEFKWSKLGNAKYRFCALKLLDYFLDHMLVAGARVDVLIWDTQDSRHNVRGRDDVKNFERMYFHLHKNVMLHRGRGALWHLRPDERLGIDWETVVDCLQATGKWPKHLEGLFESDPRSFHIKTFREVKSHAEPLCQLADLFAGMAPFSRENAHVMGYWLERESGQIAMFEGDNPPKVSNSDKERFPVIGYLHNRCRKLNLGVSLQAKGYLVTHNPRNPINFWHYEPQHEMDRAPTRDN